MVVPEPLIEPVTPGVVLLVSLPGVVVLLVPGPPIDEVPDVALPVLEVVSVLDVPDVVPLVPLVPAVLDDVEGVVSVGVEDVVGVGTASRLVQAPSERAAAASAIAVQRVRIVFMGITPCVVWSLKVRERLAPPWRKLYLLR